ncbi:unnamed protein product [Nesidiocoris tenuis]|uniref:Gustatory receptor n=1 Tax=Nesidiocoris tenuis TaxID=355587 RepID=A0A6H5G957_9HEMI|nr:unnamed protein product [Nesidiocoris tenuis]
MFASVLMIFATFLMIFTPNIDIGAHGPYTRWIMTAMEHIHLATPALFLWTILSERYRFEITTGTMLHQHRQLQAHLKIAQIFGAWPLQIDFRRNSFSKISKKYATASSVLSIWSLFMFFCPAIDIDSAGYFTKLILRSAECLSIAQPSVLFASVVLGASKIEECLRSLFKIHDELKAGGKLFFRNILVGSIVCTLMLVITWLQLVYIQDRHHNIFLIMTLTSVFWVIFFLHSYAAVLLYTVLVQSVGVCFEKLSQIKKKPPTENARETARLIIVTYDRLVDICDDINHVFTPFISCALLSHFLVMLEEIYIYNTVNPRGNELVLRALWFPIITGWEDLLFSSYSAFFWMAMYTVITCTGFQFTYLVGAISDCLLRSKTVTIAKLKEQSFRPVYRQTSDSSAIQRSNNIIKQFVLTQHQIFGIFDDFGDVYSSFVAIYLLGLFLATTNSCFVLFVTKVLIWPEIVQYVLWVLHHVVVACNLFSSCEGFREHPLVMIHLSSRKTLTFTACKCVNVDYRLGLSGWFERRCSRERTTVEPERVPGPKYAGSRKVPVAKHNEQTLAPKPLDLKDASSQTTAHSECTPEAENESDAESRCLKIGTKTSNYLDDVYNILADEDLTKSELLNVGKLLTVIGLDLPYADRRTGHRFAEKDHDEFKVYLEMPQNREVLKVYVRLSIIFQKHVVDEQRLLKRAKTIHDGLSKTVLE